MCIFLMATLAVQNFFITAYSRQLLLLSQYHNICSTPKISIAPTLYRMRQSIGLEWKRQTCKLCSTQYKHSQRHLSTLFPPPSVSEDEAVPQSAQKYLGCGSPKKILEISCGTSEMESLLSALSTVAACDMLLLDMAVRPSVRRRGAPAEE